MRRVRPALFVLLIGFILAEAPLFAGGQKEAAKSTVAFSLYMYSTDYKPIWEGIVSDFQKKNPSITVNMEVLDLGVLKDKVVTEWRAGAGPDVVLSVPEDTIDMYALGFVENLSSRFKTWADASNFYPWALSAVTVEGEYPNGFVHAVPIDATMRALVYRGDLAKKYGFANPPKTWDELKKMALAISKGEPGVSGFGFCSGQNVRTPQEFNVLLWQLGADIAKRVNGKWQIAFTEADAARILREWWYDMVKMGIVPTTDLGWGWQELDQAYAQGTVAATQNGPWMKFYSKSNPDVMAKTEFTSVPIPEGGKKATFLEVEGAVMSKNAHDKDAAWKFLTFIGGADPIRRLAEVVKLPPRKDVAEMPEFKGNKWITPWIEMAQYGHAQPGLPLAQYNTAVNTAIGDVVYMKKSPEEAAKGIVEAVNTILDTVNK